MNNPQSERPDNRNPRNPDANRLERNSSMPDDLPDNEQDSRKLESEETTINLPEVKDIPGQEFVHAPPLGEMADTTISSDDEEGRQVFESDEEQDFMRGSGADVSADEQQTLSQTEYMPTRDEDNLYRSSLDSRDFQGEKLDEESFGEKRGGGDEKPGR